jgi:hypothetical protein
MRHQHVSARIRVELELQGAGNGWTNVSRDVLVTPGVQIRRAIRGSGVNDLVAAAGSCTFTLDNMRSNSAGIPGYYSPDHPSCRPGFSETIGVRVIVVSPAVGQEIEFLGTIDELKPVPGNRGRRDVSVTCVDWMEEAAEFMLSGLQTQAEKRGDQLLTTLLAASGLKQPAGTSFDTGKETYAFAFESIRDGQQSARAEMDRIAHSGGDRIFTRRDGVLRYENREYRLINNVAPSLRLDNAMLAMAPIRSRSRVVNRLDVTAHPRSVDTGFVVLYSLQEQPFLSPGETRTIRGNFTDPDKPGSQIGAVEVQDPEAGTDFIASKTSTAITSLPNAAATLLPIAEGHYTTFALGGSTATKITAVSDGSDSTYVGPSENGGLTRQSFLFAPIVDAPDTAPVASVKAVYRFYNNQPNGGFVGYPMVRLGGIDLDLNTPTGYYETGTFGAQTFSVLLPRPGGGDWTVGDVNASDVGVFFNWGGARPFLLNISLVVAYTSETSIDTEDDATADFAVTADPGGNSATIDITNNGTAGAYLMRLQIRGKRVFSYDPVTVVSSDSTSITRNGLRPDTFDMPYQGDSSIAQMFAAYVVSLRKDPRTDIEQITILGNRSDVLMNAALRLDVSSLIEVIEPVTGVSSKYWINGVDLSLARGGLVHATWLLERADPTVYWVLGVAGRSEVGQTTIVGPM